MAIRQFTTWLVQSSLVLVSALTISMGPDSAVHAQCDPTEAITTANLQVKQTNAGLRRYHKVTRDIEGEGSEGGTLTAYFNGAELVRLDATHFHEMGRLEVHFYLRAGRVLLVQERENNYDKPLSGRVTTVKERSYYFDSNRLVHYMEGKLAVDISNLDILQKGQSLLEESMRLEGMARN